jgi:hypothetical protein
VVGRVAVDFVAARDQDQWRRYAIEINLRMTGTTHPLMLMQMLNDGRYDPDVGVYRTGRGDERVYVATDVLHSPSYQGLGVEDLLDIAALHELHYRPWTDTGVVFHLTGALSQFGKLGITAIAADQQEADAFFAATRKALDTETMGVQAGEASSSRSASSGLPNDR